MKTASKRLENQTCIVTGSSSGIGASIAKFVAKDGANIVINYHSDKEGAEEVAQSIIQDYSPTNEPLIIKCDVSKEDDVKHLFKNTIDKFGTVDICIANSGIQKDYPLHEMPLSAWQQVIDVNLTGQFLCAKEALNEFLRRGIRPEVSKSIGKIIHVSSVHEIIPWAGHANYASAKGGLKMLMESICQGYGKHKVRCNSIAPGAIKTDINKEVWSNDEDLKNVLKLIPYDQMGLPEDIGSVASWLASDEAEYINGTTIFVDGGMTCYPGFTNNG